MFQRAILSGKPLADARVLGLYGVRRHSSLHLVSRLRGGVQTLAELSEAVDAAHRHELLVGKCWCVLQRRSATGGATSGILTLMYTERRLRGRSASLTMVA